MCTAWKLSKYGVFSGPNAGKYRPEKTPYLDTFHEVVEFICEKVSGFELVTLQNPVHRTQLKVVSKLSFQECYWIKSPPQQLPT